MKKIHMIMSILPILEKIIKKSPTRDFFFIYILILLYRKNRQIFTYTTMLSFIVLCHLQSKPVHVAKLLLF